MKNVLILGGNGEIGSAIKDKFRVKGYAVTAPRSSELDLSDLTAAAEFNTSTAGFDVIIQCAGINNPVKIKDLEIDLIRQTLNINILSFVEIVKANIPYFEKQKSGHILGISSIYGTVAREGRAAYVMSKHAMNGFIKTCAIELGKYNVKCNTLSPGYVNTKLTSKNNSEETIEGFRKKIPLGELAKPDFMAEIAYFLCSEENKYINGQDIIADGGFLCGGFQL